MAREVAEREIEAAPRRIQGAQLLGISEIAREVGCSRHVVANWHARGKLPPPAEALAAGPVWRREQVAEFIEAQRARQAKKIVQP